MKISKLSLTIYCILISFIVLSSGYLIISADKKSPVEIAAEQAVSAQEGWTDENGKLIENLTKLNLLENSSSEKFSSIYYKLPNNIGSGQSFCLRAKHIYLEVYIDGKCLYFQDLPENRLYTNSIGANWLQIPLEPEDSGKKLELRYKMCYKNSSCGIDNISINTAKNNVITIISKKISGFVISIIFTVIGVLFMFFDIPLNRGTEKRHELLYLGLFSMGIAGYCLVETQLFQLFIGNERIMHILSCYSLMMIPIPVIFYISEFFGFKYKYTCSIYTYTIGLLDLALIIMNYADIADYHDTLTIINLSAVSAAVMLIYSMLRYTRENLRDKDRNIIYPIIRIIGLAALAVTGVIDIIRFYFLNAQDPAAFLRVGVLIFVICFGLSTMERALNMISALAKAEMITKLAYTDVLTDSGNRTAYTERLDDIIRSGFDVGIVALDINNLKKVNDTLGHSCGDKLIADSADIIRKAFKGECYRIGGDEFMVIVLEGDLEKNCCEGKSKLVELCKEYNEVKDRKFDIYIACGYALFNKETPMHIACSLADQRMYENKKAMKAALKQPDWRALTENK